MAFRHELDIGLGVGDCFITLLKLKLSFYASVQSNRLVWAPNQIMHIKGLILHSPHQWTVNSYEPFGDKLNLQ